MRALGIALAAVAAYGVAGTAAAQDLLIRGARVHTASAAGTLENADVLVQDGRIVQVGTGLAAPADAKVVEAQGRALTPGLFGGLTQIGVEEVSLEPATVDEELALAAPAWQHQWRPEFDVTRAFDPRSTPAAVARVEGVTWTLVSPLSDTSVVAGQGAAMLLDGDSDAPLAGSRTLFLHWGAAADQGSGGSRAAQYMLFDQAMREVREPGTAREGALLQPEGRAALKSYLAGGRVVFRATRASDIRQVIRYAKRHGMKPVIAGGDEGWMVARELAAEGVPVILNPLDNLPASFDRLGARLDNAKRLHEAGVQIAFSSGDGHMARKNRQLAGNAVAHGLPWEAALAAITSGAADIFGIAGERGRIETGQAADLVLWSGDPLEVTSVADQVWIAGRAIEMRSRQTELAARYLDLLRSNARP